MVGSGRRAQGVGCCVGLWFGTLPVDFSFPAELKPVLNRSRGGTEEGNVTESRPRIRLQPVEWVLAVVLAASFVPAVISLAGVWSSLDYYSHGFLVPVVALFIAKSAAAPFAPRDGRGIAAMAVCVGLYGWGVASGSVSLQGVALVGAVAGAVLYVGGPGGVRVFGFPLLFLLFMVPLPQEWIRPVIVQLQLLVSSSAVELLQATGSGVVQRGNVLDLARGESLLVAEACSGITSIVTLMPLGVVLAYFTERSWPRRLGIVAAVVPAAMLANLLRVVATVWAAERFGAEQATGNPLHETAGLITFALACLALMGVGSAMRRWLPARS